MPPLGGVDAEPLGLHRGAQQVAHAALLGGPARVVAVRPLGEVVVGAGHLDLFARLEIVEGEIDGAAAVVARALRRISDELLLVRRRDLPEELRHGPGAVAVEDQEAESLRAQLTADAQEGLSRRPLQEGARLRVDPSAREVVLRRVAYVELDGPVEPLDLHQVGRAKVALLARRLLLRRREGRNEKQRDERGR